jgi:hypothetical protein
VTQAKNEIAVGVLGQRRRFGDGYHIVDELLHERTETLRKFPLLWKAITLGLPFLPDVVEWADRLGPRTD